MNGTMTSADTSHSHKKICFSFKLKDVLLSVFPHAYIKATITIIAIISRKN